MIIYMATNKRNNKKYIGLTTKTLEERMSTHKNDARRGNTYFNRAIRKYGVEGFTWEVLDTASDLNELQEKEVYYIEKYGTFDNKEKGYNTASGGQYFTVTEEERLKRSQRATGKNNPMYGVPSPMKGKKFTKEHREKLSKSGREVDRHWLVGGTNPSASPVIELTTLTVYDTQVEAIEKTGVSSAGLHYSLSEGKYIKGMMFSRYDKGSTYSKVPKGPKRNSPVMNESTGEVFQSISEASEEYGCARKGIRDCCNGKRETYKSYKWKYI